MNTTRPIDEVAVKGYKSIRDQIDIRLDSLNVFVGANGSGKSNLVSLFRLVADIVDQRLRYRVAKEGGPDRLLHQGSKVTPSMGAFFKFGTNGYGFRLEPTAGNTLMLADEAIYWEGNVWSIPAEQRFLSLGSGLEESKLREAYEEEEARNAKGILHFVYPSVKSWTVYHFHDTSESAELKKRQWIRDSGRLFPDAANLAPLLFRLRTQEPRAYQMIRNIVRLAVPYFEDFEVDPLVDNPEQTELRWRQSGSEYTFHASQLSDGSLRLMCLVLALLQPNPPRTIIIDEPELGLHPYALTLVAGLAKQASLRAQVILCTQSPTLLNEFEPAEVIVTEHRDGTSKFERLDPVRLASWLEDFSLGQLWQKNVIGGGPGR
ncbi:MAG: AAA family ATPase [Deltaproteobacteria bacterium]|nr:AAA family ATPase [Deltaproteobacteria bacterium]